ncbi:MAG TPA: hypothetical protein PKA64_25725 [Myxococcota bacterium]|nr:hypothetical protein [Myxococcota bacterium]
MRGSRFVLFVLLSGCDACKEQAVCCLSSDGTVAAGTVTGDPTCPDGGALLASREVDDDDDKALGSPAEDRVCGSICCVVGEQRALVSFPTCVDRNGQALQAEACDGVEEDPPAASTCACRDAGVTFTVVSGCEGPAFNDATTASYCVSHVTENLSGDPETTRFGDGDVFGFPACQVRIRCP